MTVAVSSPPTFSILVPVYRTPPSYLAEMIGSVTGQTNGSFELILVDDGSGDLVLTENLERVAAADPRIVVVVLTQNSGIVAATAAGLRVARGEFVALLDHDDMLVPVALQRVAETLADAAAAGQAIDVLYTDEDQLHPDGEFRGAFHKPDYSPERLRGQMYFGHLTVYRRTLLVRIDGFRVGLDGSQDYDLALRATEVADGVWHLPEVLYHWRIHPESVSHRGDNAPVFDAAQRALTDHLRRTGIDGTVEQVHPVGVYRIRRRLARTPLVSIIIPTRGSRAYTRGADRVMVVDAVRSLVERSSYPDYEIIIVADAPTPDSVLADLSDLAGERLRVVPFSGPFSFSAKINMGAVHAQGELLMLLNDDVEILTSDWIETMVALAVIPDVGMVGAKLLYEDGTVQHLGHLYERGDVTHLASGAPADWPGPVADLLVEREVSGVTAACALLRREVFELVGGLSPAFPVAFNDVDLSLKLTGAGYRILITPFAVLHHFETKTRERSVASHEVIALRRRWDHRLLVDPFWRHDPADVAVGQAAATQQAQAAPDR
jgi:GT2 family glycosyltransferase